MDLGDRISELCEIKGVSLNAMEKACGLRSTAARWNIHSPSLDKVQTVAAYFGVTVSELLGETETAPGMEPEAVELWEDYCLLDDAKQRVVRAVMRELGKQSIRRNKRSIAMFPAAAGPGEPADGEPFESYDVPEDGKADFAVRISGDSMEPHFKHGQVVLCKRGYPEIGDIAVVSVNGNIYVKQFVTDGRNIYLVSLNRKRSDCDYTIWHDTQDTVKCYGTVIMDKRLPLAK